VSLRAADLRFVLPHEVETAVVVGEHPWARVVAAGLEAAGIGAPRSGQPPDLLVVHRSDGARAQGRPARAKLTLGGAHRRAGALDVLVRGPVQHPITLLPLSPADSFAHYLTGIATPGRVGRARNRALANAAGVRLARRAASIASVSLPGGVSGVVPAFVAAARHLVPGAGPNWVLQLGNGDDLQRAVFHLFESGRPRWVLKFVRVAGVSSSFERDEAGLRLAAGAGPSVAAHAPALLGRFEFGGRAASVETAAAGRPLLGLLAERPMQLIDDIAEWIIELGAVTARPGAASAVPVPGGSAEWIGGLPGVLQHNDLGTWNIVTDGSGFTVVDWESARSDGLPLWDLLYFLADALTRIDGHADPETLLRRALVLFRGGSPHSARLFGWVRRAAQRLAIPAEAVGPIATLCWIHHAGSAAVRQDGLAGAPAAALGHLARMAEPWAAEPALGRGWSQWTE
jgi:hypothetical protein